MSDSRFIESDAETFRTLLLFRQSLRFLAPFKGRVFGKLGFLFVSFIPWLLLPWPIKIVLDHVVLGTPVGEETTPYPFFIEPFIVKLAGATPLQILLAVIAVQVLLVLVVGAFGVDKGERDQAGGQLAGGQDIATQTENAANAGFSLAGGLLGFLDFRWTMRLTHLMNHHYRSMLFGRIQTLPMSAFDDARIGDAVYRVMYDTPSVTESTYRIVLTPIGSAAYILVSVGLLTLTFGDHPQIYWSALAFAPLVLLVTLPFAAYLRRRSGSARQAGATTTSRIEESLTNVLAVQSLGGNERERGRFDRDSWESFRRYRGVVLVGMGALAAVLVPGFALGGATFVYIVDLVVDGTISVGDFTLVVTYFLQILYAAVDLGSFWIELQVSAAGLNRVFFLMEQPGEADDDGQLDVSEVREGLRFEDVRFAYPDGTEVLHGVSLEARMGQVTAIVGPAGSGKTTLANMIPRFHDPSNGRVTLDGRDVREFSRKALRDRIGFVFQETALFDETVSANIRIAKPEASETEIRRACRIAGADDFIRALPEGYETRLGRAGSKLSVGQKQRISIARALVREPEILILDEPTSALDPDTEGRLVRALHEASRNSVVLVIAHRLSTIRTADQICFLDSGRIVERGTHEELMSKPEGAYRRYVEIQTTFAA